MYVLKYYLPMLVVIDWFMEIILTAAAETVMSCFKALRF